LQRHCTRTGLARFGVEFSPVEPTHVTELSCSQHSSSPYVTASVKMIRFSYSSEDIKDEEEEMSLMAGCAHGLGAALRAKPMTTLTPADPRQAGIAGVLCSSKRISYYRTWLAITGPSRTAPQHLTIYPLSRNSLTCPQTQETLYIDSAKTEPSIHFI
jgi:hypothetical protein